MNNRIKEEVMTELTRLTPTEHTVLEVLAAETRRVKRRAVRFAARDWAARAGVTVAELDAVTEKLREAGLIELRAESKPPIPRRWKLDWSVLEALEQSSS